MSGAPEERGTGPAPDDAGYCAWISLRASTLRRKAYLLCGDWHTADDLVQEALIALYPKWSRLARDGHVDAYANRVLVGKYVDAQRRPWRRERPFDDVPERADLGSERDLAAVDDADGPLAAALASLPESQRVVVVLRFTDDLSVDEIARAVGVPTGTVKSRLARGTDAIRSHLERHGHLPRAVPASPGIGPDLRTGTSTTEDAS